MVRRTSSQDKPSLGVDLVELKRAKAFYRVHRSRLNVYFSDEEIAFVKRARRRGYERLAVLLAAKEAAFKASGQPWMGPEGFRSILVEFSSEYVCHCLAGRLTCRTDSPLPVRRFSLTILVRKHFVVARCAGIS
jgi:phosphopantetheine--protein transferase-like protein